MPDCLDNAAPASAKVVLFISRVTLVSVFGSSQFSTEVSCETHILEQADVSIPCKCHVSRQPHSPTTSRGCSSPRNCESPGSEWCCMPRLFESSTPGSRQIPNGTRNELLVLPEIDFWCYKTESGILILFKWLVPSLLFTSHSPLDGFQFSSSFHLTVFGL